MSKCWIVYSDDVLPMGIELDYWVKLDGDTAFDHYCKLYPFAEFYYYEVENYGEPNEKSWKQLDYREGAYNTKEDDKID